MVARGSVFVAERRKAFEDIRPSCSRAIPAPVPLTLVYGDREHEPRADWSVGFRMAWNLLALVSGPFAFGFALYWLIGHVWWEGLAASILAPFLGLALIAIATLLETVRKQSNAITPSVTALRYARSAGDVGG
jgi:hypothetical protein